MASDSEQLGTKYPGMWQLPSHMNRCNIYRVPTSLRETNPEAYTPRLIIIGPLHHALKARARSSLDDRPDSRSLDYLNTEEIKKRYFSEFSEILQPQGMSIAHFRSIILQREKAIRDCYSESTAWISSTEFVDMILCDAVFMIMFMGKTASGTRDRSGDPLLDMHCLENDIKRDLMLLENQLPFFILDDLFASIVPTLFPLFPGLDLVKLAMVTFFPNERRVGHPAAFLHFTDLMRSVYKLSIPGHDFTSRQGIENMPSADQLSNRGVKFEVLEENLSLSVRFDSRNGVLKIPRLCVHDKSEVTLRNLVAFEQCHYPHVAHVCSYLEFIDFLIDTDKDIDLLVEQGVITSWVGKPSLVAEMVNKLRHGISVGNFSCYSHIATQVNAYYQNPFNKSCSFLKRVYFGNMWTGTATFAAALLLALTITQTVGTLLQLRHS